MIAEHESIVAEIDKEIGIAQTVVDKLVAKKQRQLDQIYAYHAALCPAHRLPHELVAEVLVLARESWESAFPLSRICRAWRQVAISTPQLWTEIKLYVESWTIPKKMFLLKTFCERSSGLRLSVAIETEEPEYDEEWDGMRLVEGLRPYLEQFDSLSLTVPGNTFLALVNLPADSFVHLRSFFFSSEYLDVDGVVFPTITIPDIVSFASARHLSLFSYHGRLPSSTVLQLPEQLAELSLRRLTTSQCMQILPYTPNLKALTIQINSRIEEIDQTQQNMVIPMLQLQELGVCFWDQHRSIIDYITAPSLLTCKFDNDSSWSMSSFSSFLARSSFSLTRLSFKKASMPGNEFLECLSLLSSLTELDLEDVTCLDDFTLSQLIYRPGHTINLLPSLSVLNIQRGEIYNFNIRPADQLYIDIVTSRWRPDISRPSRLSRCRLRFWSFSIPQEHARSQVDMLRNEGLDIKIAFSKKQRILKTRYGLMYSSGRFSWSDLPFI